MAKKAFYSFHYHPDNWRVSQVRNIGAVEDNAPASDHDWEEIKKGGDPAIKRWIDGQMSGRNVAVVLIGQETAGRKWINYEITKAWEDKRGVLGIYIHRLKDRNGATSYQGANPFSGLKANGNDLGSIVQTYNPPYTDSKDVYNYIAENISKWIDDAIALRNKY